MHSHRLDPLSLIAGVVFVLIGIGQLVGGVALGWLTLARLWPVLLVGAGVAVLFGLLRRTDET